MSEVVLVFSWPRRAAGAVWEWPGAAAVLMGRRERIPARSIHPAVSSCPPPARLRHGSGRSRPARAPRLRRDPGHTPSHILLPCCHEQSGTPLPEPPSTYVQSQNCKERPLPSSLSSPRACSPWVKNAVFPEIGSPPTLALRPELLDTF